MAEDTTGNSETLEKFRQFVGALKHEGSSSKPDVKILKAYDGSVSLLCRTNAEALQLATSLEEAGIKFHLRAFHDERGIPPWVGRVFSTYTSRMISKKAFNDRWGDLVGENASVSLDEAWHLAKTIEGKRNPDLELPVLHNRLLKGQRFPEELDPFIQTDLKKLALSTIHGVKGREFDKVIMLEPEQRGVNTNLEVDTDFREESRILYVAATRARKDLARMLRTNMPHMWRPDYLDNRRWLSSFPGSDYLFMELGILGDIDPLGYVNMFTFVTEEKVRQSQDAIWSRKNSNFLVSVKKVRQNKNTFFKVFFDNKENTANSLPLTQLSLGVKQDMQKILREIAGSKFRYPNYWDAIPVMSIVTEVFNKSSDDVRQYAHSAYRRSGFCIGIRVKKMVYLSKWRKHAK